MDIGKRIKELREKRAITQTDFAKAIGVSKQTLYKYENGIVTNIPSDRIEIIAKALNTSPSNLMGWEQTIRNNADAIYDQYIDAINEGKTVRSMTVHEATLLDAYRESDEQTKEMAERILFYRKGIGGEEK